MRITRANVLSALSAGAIFAVGCSSDEEPGIYLAPDSSTAETGGSVSTGGRATGGRNATGGRTGGTGGRSTGGGGAGGANTGGSNTGGATTDAGTGGAGTGGAATGGAGPDASAGGTPNTGGAQNTGGAATGGTQNTGGTPNTGGAQNTGGASTGGAQSTGGAPTDAGTGDGSTDGGGVQKNVFVTSGAWDGTLDKANLASGTDGLQRADILCNASASAAGLGGNWRAWLSDGTTNAISRINDVGPWYRLDGALVFANKAAMAGNPVNPIDMDENRDQPGDFQHQHPWTGTQANGTKAANLCNNWDSGTTGNGECGQTTSKTPTWTDAGGFQCSIPYPLYCFEQ